MLGSFVLLQFVGTKNLDPGQLGDEREYPSSRHFTEPTPNHDSAGWALSRDSAGWALSGNQTSRCEYFVCAFTVNTLLILALYW